LLFLRLNDLRRYLVQATISVLHAEDIIRAQFYYVNMNGTQNALDAAFVHGVQRII